MPRPPRGVDVLLFLGHFEDLKDPRRHQHKVVYPLPMLLLVAFGAALCGMKDWEAAADFAEEKREWLRRLWMFEGDETPSADTLERVFSRLDAKTFRECFVRWMQAVAAARRGGDSGKPIHIAMDGKSVQGARDASAPTVPMHLLHAFLVEHELVLGMEPASGAPGETAAAKAVLAVLELRSAMVSGDANFLTKDIADIIVEGGGDFLFALKGNRGPAHAAVETALMPAGDGVLDEITLTQLAKTTDDTGETKGHGRVERRRAWACPAEKFAAVKKYLPHAKTVLIIERQRRATPESNEFKPSTEVHFYVSSRDADAAALAGWVRAHWGVENLLHRNLDVVLHEDATRVRKSPAAENLATLRRVALATLRHDKTLKGSAPKKMRRATFNDDYRAELIMNAVS